MSDLLLTSHKIRTKSKKVGCSTLWWLIEKVHLGNLCSIRYIEITLIVSIKTCKEVTQLVSTPNKRSSSGEMKIDLKGVGLYRGDGLDTLEDQR